MSQKLSKFLVVLGTILAIGGFANFFYAHSYTSLVNGVGFALIAFGNYKTGGTGEPRLYYFATILGLLICISSMVLDHMK